MKWAFFLALVVLLCGCLSPTHLVMQNRPGGILKEHYAEYDRYARAGTKIEFKGSIASAATIFIGLPGACTYPDTVFRFHAPIIRFSTFSILAPSDTVNKMISYYPPKLREWYRRNIPTNKKNDFVDLTGKQLIDMMIISEC